VSCGEAWALTDNWWRRTLLVLKEAIVFFPSARGDGKETLYLHGGALASAMSPTCSVVR
jgi:hypothetical protein